MKPTKTSRWPSFLSLRVDQSSSAGRGCDPGLRCGMVGTVPRPPPPRRGGFSLGVCSPSMSRALDSGRGPLRTTLFWLLKPTFQSVSPNVPPSPAPGHGRPWGTPGPPSVLRQQPQLQADNRSSAARTGYGKRTSGSEG